MALEFSSGLMVMDLALSLLWCKFDPLLRDFCMLWTQTKKKKKKKKKRKKEKKMGFSWCSFCPHLVHSFRFQTTFESRLRDIEG